MQVITEGGIRFGLGWAVKLATVATGAYVYFEIYKIFIIETLLRTEV